MKIILILSLIPIIWEDFKHREIRIWFLLLFILVSILSVLYVNPLRDLSINFALTFAFFLTIIGVNVIIQSIKAKQFVNIIDRNIGLGDLVFWIGLAFQFYFPQLILFFISTSIIILIIFFKSEKTIPLAGIQACFLVAILLLEEFYNLGRFENFLQL